MILDNVDQGIVALHQKIEPPPSPTSSVPWVRRKSSTLSSGSVNPSEMDFQETINPLTKALMALQESVGERLTIQRGTARLPVSEDFAVGSCPVLRVCRPALAIKGSL